jgi:heme exporter protein A
LSERLRVRPDVEGDHTPEAVAAEGLWRANGRERVLRGVSLHVAASQGVAILGPNGSGKTTLLRCLAAILRPSRGKVWIFGEDPWANPAVRRKIGFVSHEPMLYGGLSVLENLRLLGSLYGVPDARARGEAVCERVGLSRRNDPVRVLSRGMQQRAAFARAILHDPPVLLLDEVLSGLDLEGAHAVGEFLREFRDRGGTVIMATHSPAEALRIAESAYVLAGGRLSDPRSLEGLAAEGVADWYRATTRVVSP